MDQWTCTRVEWPKGSQRTYYKILTGRREILVVFSDFSPIFSCSYLPPFFSVFDYMSFDFLICHCYSVLVWAFKAFNLIMSSIPKGNSQIKNSLISDLFYVCVQCTVYDMLFVYYVAPFQILSDMIGNVVNLILWGNWSLPTVHMGHTPYIWGRQ